MLASSKIVGIVPTLDSKRAREFYEGKLGFEFISDDPFALVVRAGDTKIRVSKVPKDFTPLPFTILGWEVQNIEAVAAWLKGRGVTCQKYPFGKDKNRASCQPPGAAH